MDLMFLGKQCASHYALGASGVGKTHAAFQRIIGGINMSNRGYSVSLLVLTIALILNGVNSAAALPVYFGGDTGGWTCIGTCGIDGPDGDVPASPNGPFSPFYGYVSTAGGPLMQGLSIPGPERDGAFEYNGSTLTSPVFFANAGYSLNLNFNYITSDNDDWPDYAWAKLVNASDHSVAAVLFTARTTPSGNTAPGFSMPAINATLNPSSVTITPGSNGVTTWSPLGTSSGSCFLMGLYPGCGTTGWISSNYHITTPGDYILEAGVVNWGNGGYDSGLAFSVPEPASLILVSIGLSVISLVRSRNAI